MEGPNIVGKVRQNEEYSDSQAGGHAGIMIFEGDRLLKKSKQNEINFFEWLYTQNTPILEELKLIAPRFYGVDRRQEGSYIILENLLNDYTHPNIMDCKLGRVTWTSHHTEETIRNQEAKNKLTTTGSLGFRISGLVIKSNTGEKLEQLVKKDAFYKITDQNIHEFFRKIITVDGEIQSDVLNFFIQETEKIKNWFERQTEKHFVASSVLYINGKNGKSQVRYIDFAHAENANGEIDRNVLEGLENVINIWKRLL